MSANQQRSVWTYAFVTSVATAGLMTVVLSTNGLVRPAGADPRVSSSVAREQALTHANDLSAAFRMAANDVSPAVVTITHTPKAITVKNDKGAPRRPQGRSRVPDELKDMDPLFKRFFEEGPGTDDDSPQFRQRMRPSSGSGVIIDPKGVILTNNHVVAGGGEVMVQLADGREFPATEVLTDPDTDIAVVKINAGGQLPHARMGNSDQVQVGDWVIAVGQPFNLSGTVTAGIISSKQRGLGITEQEEFLQTDAAINPGNSGGPLVNLAGEVVGINTAISSTSGGYQGVGFAVPVNLAKWVAEQLQHDGKVQRSYLGVGIHQVDQDLANNLGMTLPRGAVVTDVRNGSPADKAGIKVEDVIVDYGGVEIHGPKELSSIAQRSPVGSKQTVVVMRDGKKVPLTVTVDAMPNGFRTAATKRGQVEVGESVDIKTYGVAVTEVTTDVAEKLGQKVPQGVLVTSVKEDSIAAKAGLTEGTVIERVGNTPVRSVAEAKELLSKEPGPRGLLLLVRTVEGTRFVVLKG